MEEISSMQKYLTFSLAGQDYGTRINVVQEIIQVVEITKVPRTHDFVQGVINLRGKVVPVIDLRMKFGVEESEYSRSTCIIVVETDSGLVGVIVDQVNEVIELSANQIDERPALGGSSDIEFVEGMGKLDDKVIILVDVIGALSTDEISRVLAAA